MQLFRSNNLRYLFIHGLYRAGNQLKLKLESGSQT